MNKIFFLGLILIFSFSHAQEGKDSRSKPQTKVEMSFDDELVKGETLKPDLNFLALDGKFNYKKLIRLRENFIPEAQKGRGEFNEK